MNRRTLILGLGLLASVAWSAWTLTSDGDSADTVQPVLRRPQASVKGSEQASATPAVLATGTAAISPALALPDRAPGAAKGINAFGAYNYQPAPVPHPAALAAAPHAPPLPFVFTGRLIIDGRTRYLFLQADNPLEVSLGANLGDFTLVEASADQLIFLHGPTGDRVTVAIANAAIR